MRRGEIRWYTFEPPDKRRPILILTRDEVIDSLSELIVVPATTTIRGLSTEIILTTDDGMPKTCALNFDHVALARKAGMGAVICTIKPELWPDIRKCLLIAAGFSE